MAPPGMPCIRRPRSAISVSPSSKDMTPASAAATNSPTLWPTIAVGWMPRLIQSRAVAYSITNSAGCATMVQRIGWPLPLADSGWS